MVDSASFTADCRHFTQMRGARLACRKSTSAAVRSVAPTRSRWRTGGLGSGVGATVTRQGHHVREAAHALPVRAVLREIRQDTTSG
jgi:hypothetical protein